MKIQITAEKCFWIYDREIKTVGLPPIGSVISIDEQTNFYVKWYYYRGEKDWLGRLIPRAVGEFVSVPNSDKNVQESDTTEAK